MAKSGSSKSLDIIFEALASQHRREIFYSLALQPYSISQLAAQRNLSLPAIHKHIKLLKKAKLLHEKKIGNVRFLTLNRTPLRLLQEWVMQYQSFWGNNEETLENYAAFLKQTKRRKEVKKK